MYTAFVAASDAGGIWNAPYRLARSIFHFFNHRHPHCIGKRIKTALARRAEIYLPADSAGG